MTCAEVGLDSDFTHLVDTVSEEMFKEALRSEAGGLKMLGYGTSGNPSLFLEDSDGKPPEFWVHLGSRVFQSCGIPAIALEVHPLGSDPVRILVL